MCSRTGKTTTSRFWDECRQHDATVTNYIGELLRYLMNQPAGPGDRQHRIDRIFGNGLRLDIWDAFKQRFGICHARCEQRTDCEGCSEQVEQGFAKQRAKDVHYPISGPWRSAGSGRFS